MAASKMNMSQSWQHYKHSIVPVLAVMVLLTRNTFHFLHSFIIKTLTTLVSVN